MNDEKWSDAFLDDLRAQGDDAARRCLDGVGGAEGRGFGEINRAFRSIRTNTDRPPADAPRALHTFWDELPRPDVDAARIRRGQDAFLEHGVLCVISLLNKSLLEGYSAPCLTQVLAVSGDLEKRTFRRLMGVLQMVLDVLADDGFAPHGRALALAGELRLLHEGVRRLVHRMRPEFADEHGIPANHEDMLATLMGFSLLPVEGLRAFGADTTPEQEEDLFYVWRCFGEAMGIPREAIPVDLDDARAFYAAFGRRHFVAAHRNPEGVALAAADLRLLESTVDGWRALLGLRALPRILCRHLMTPQALERVEVPPVAGHPVLNGVVDGIIALRRGVGSLPLADRAFHRGEKLACRLLLQGLVRAEYHGKPGVAVPRTVQDLWRL